mgnify:CR=1 FL=1
MSVLLPYQQRWVADTSQVRVCEKSRRVGLSWAEAAGSALEAAKQTGGQDTWYIGYNKDMAEEFILDVAFWAKHYQLAAEEMEQEVIVDERGDILTFKIRFASGNRVTALSSRPSNLRGKAGRVIIDEAAFHPDLEQLLKAAFALLIWGGSVSVISTHDGVDNAFNELVLDIRAGKRPYSLHKITFDEAVEQGLCERVFQTTKREYSLEAERNWCQSIRDIYKPNDAEELDVIPSNSSGAYLSRALIEMRMTDEAPVVRYTCKKGFEELADYVREADADDWLAFTLAPILAKFPSHYKAARSSSGMDFARNGDLSVFLPLLELQGLERVCPFILEMHNVPFKQQEQIVFWIIDRLPRFCFGAFDARGNGQYMAEVAMQRYGSSSIAQVMLSNKWYGENMPRMKAAFEDGTLASIPKDRDVLDDLRQLVMEKGVPKLADNARSKGKDGAQRHGDTAIALALAWFASSQEGGGGGEYIPVDREGDAPQNSNFMRPSENLDVPSYEHDSRRS